MMCPHWISRETSSCFHAKIISRLQILTRDSTTVARSVTAVVVSSLSWQPVGDKEQEIRPALSIVQSALKSHVIYFSISENSWHLQQLSLKPRDCSSPWRVCCLSAKKRKAKGELRPALTCCHSCPSEPAADPLKRYTAKVLLTCSLCQMSAAATSY